MRSIFSAAGRSALARLNPGKTLIGLDFDGTIAPLVADPDDAFTRPDLHPILKKLSGRAPVVVISGRSVNDIRSRLYFRPRRIIGNHGLEGLREFRLKASRANLICRKWMRQLNSAVPDLTVDQGIYLEDKRHSLSLHYRHAPEPLRAKRFLRQEIKRLRPPPRVIGGKLIFNLVPKGSPHKGKALKFLMRQYRCSQAVFIGDDVTDEDAFAEKGDLLTIRVGKSQGSRAQFYVRDQNEMSRVLRLLTAHFD